MGHPTGRIPGPTAAPVQPPSDWLSGVMRNLSTEITAEKNALKFDLSHIAQDLLTNLKDIYASENWTQDKGDEGNFTDPTPAHLPGGRERDAGLQQKDAGSRFKDSTLLIRLGDTHLSPDFKTLTLNGRAKSTLEIGTPYPSKFDSPTDIPITITTTSLGASEISASGYAKAYKIFRANFDLHLHYDSGALIKALGQLAKERNLTRKEMEQLLSTMSFDASASMLKKNDLLCLSCLNVSASSILPLKRPVLGALDDILPAQVLALPDRDIRWSGLQVIPKGVFFPVLVPALGWHRSRFGRDEGYSGTIAVLGKPDLDHIGKAQAFAYLDFQYAKRLTDTIDLKVSLTYTYTNSKTPQDAESLQFEYLKASSKSWLPESRENLPPGDDHSGHNVLLQVKGTFDAL